MALPDLPEGLFWSVKKIPGLEEITLFVWVKDAPRLVPVAEKSVKTQGHWGEATILGAIQEAAGEVVEALNRDCYVDSVIEKVYL